MRFQAARSISVTVALGSRTAAVLTRMCRPPNAFAARSTASRVCDSEETSHEMVRSAWTRARSRSTPATLAPACRSAVTMALPMPPAAPVTTAALPSSENFSFISSSPQVRFLDAWIVLQVRAALRRDDAPGLYDITPARCFKRVARILLDQQDAGAGRVHGADGAKDVLHHERRKAERRLVHAEKLRLGHECAPERQHLLLPA